MWRYYGTEMRGEVHMVGEGGLKQIAGSRHPDSRKASKCSRPMSQVAAQTTIAQELKKSARILLTTSTSQVTSKESGVERSSSYS